MHYVPKLILQRVFSRTCFFCVRELAHTSPSHPSRWPHLLKQLSYRSRNSGTTGPLCKPSKEGSRSKMLNLLHAKDYLSKSPGLEAAAVTVIGILLNSTGFQTVISLFAVSKSPMEPTVMRCLFDWASLVRFGSESKDSSKNWCWFSVDVASTAECDR